MNFNFESLWQTAFYAAITILASLSTFASYLLKKWFEGIKQKDDEVVKKLNDLKQDIEGLKDIVSPLQVGSLMDTKINIYEKIQSISITLDLILKMISSDEYKNKLKHSNKIKRGELSDY